MRIKKKNFTYYPSKIPIVHSIYTCIKQQLNNTSSKNEYETSMMYDKCDRSMPIFAVEQHTY